MIGLVEATCYLRFISSTVGFTKRDYVPIFISFCPVRPSHKSKTIITPT